MRSTASALVLGASLLALSASGCPSAKPREPSETRAARSSTPGAPPAAIPSEPNARAAAVRADLAFVDASVRELSTELETLETGLEEPLPDDARTTAFDANRGRILERAARLVEGDDPAMAEGLRARAREPVAWGDEAVRRSVLDLDLAAIAPAFERAAIGLGSTELRCESARTLAGLFLERAASKARIGAHLDRVELDMMGENRERPSRAVLARSRAHRELADALGSLSSGFPADPAATSARVLSLPTPESGEVVGAFLPLGASLGLARAACRWNEAVPGVGPAPTAAPAATQPASR